MAVDDTRADHAGTGGAVAVDLNSDLGEGFGHWELGDDEALLGTVTSANVACGFHAGDPAIMRRMCERAAEVGVVIGAQVSYRDLAGFGRRFIDATHDELVGDVLYQIGALDAMARVAGERVRYVKPHGALYNATVTHAGQAAAVSEAVAAYDPTLPVLGLPGSQLLRHAEAAGLTTIREAFADRAYTPEGHLVSRREPGAVLQDADEIAARCLRMAREGLIIATDGTRIPVSADSICVHGDTPGAVAVARAVRDALTGGDVRLRSFLGAS